MCNVFRHPAPTDLVAPIVSTLQSQEICDWTIVGKNNDQPASSSDQGGDGHGRQPAALLALKRVLAFHITPT